MSDKPTRRKPTTGPYIFDCDSLPIPPGTKSEPVERAMGEPPPKRIGLLLGGTAVVALLLGVAIGRFLLP